MQIKFIFGELDWSGTDVDANYAHADILGVEVDGKRHDFESPRLADGKPFVVWDGLWLKVIDDGEESIETGSQYACIAIGDEDQDHLNDFGRAFKAQALEHFLSDRFIECAEFDELFSFEHEERKAAAK